MFSTARHIAPKCSSSFRTFKRFRSLYKLPLIEGQQPDSYLHRKSTSPYVYTNVGRLVDCLPDRFGDELAFADIALGVRKTFPELKDEVNKLASGFLALNLKKGDRIAVWGPNRFEWLLTQYAAAKAGLILVTINPAYQAPEFEFCLDKAEIKSVVFPESFFVQKYYSMINSLIPELSESKEGFIKTKRFPHLESLIVMDDHNLPGTFKFSDVMKAGGSQEVKDLGELQKRINPDDPVAIIFTSGTTARPKAATLSHFSTINANHFISKCLGFHDEKHTLCCHAPMFHVLGMVGGGMSTLVTGIAIIFPSHEYSAQKAITTIEKEKCTVVYGTPTMYIDMMRNPEFQKKDMSSLKSVFIGGARVPPELINQLYKAFPRAQLSVGYGSTESGGMGTIDRFDPTWTNEQLDNTGRVIDNLEMKIVNANNEVVPLGTDGEICTRGATQMIGYWNDEEKTKEAFRDGWYRTGDLGSMAADGVLTVKGRIKEIIIRGGENINSKEIEDVLVTHPSIMDAQVIGVYDERLGEDVCAWVRLVENAALTEKELRGFCEGKMAYYKIPRYIRFVKAFPVTLSGKVQKFKMVAEMNEILKATSAK